ncbi:MAG: hypothetical protein MMC33_009736 [Icmadophila ericetorum]|nr:hypothetical protein [Icmadophila ericetorum]
MENGSLDQRGEEPRDIESDEENNEKTIARGGSSSGGHKRSLSGSILSKLSFLRSSTDSSESKYEGGSNNNHSNRSSAPHKSAMTSAVEQRTTRKRKGSLRKTAILGTGRLKVDARERKTSNLEPIRTSRTYVNDGPTSPEDILGPESPLSPEDLPTPRPSTDLMRPSGLSDLIRSDTNESTTSTASNRSNNDFPPPLGISRQPTYGELSTTDDDEAGMFLRNPILTTSTTLPKKPSQVSDSYFPPASASTRRSSQKSKSPLSTSLPSLPPASSSSSSNEWDHSPTVRWGYIILVSTWLVFTVGMGSCFEVWSWAWDVGETPYAPPELEDDPTLPIVGYYPALMVLTGVMAWVWVVVAWVGMKYFRHAKIPDV